jgi:dTMP kinase
MTKSKGYFISLEGLDGCGKSTHIRLLADYLGKKGYSVLQIREPGGCAVSEKIRKILLSREHTHMAPDTELLLYWAARAQLIAEVISPALLQGKFIIADRFGWSTFAYQGYGRGMDLRHISYLKKIVCGSVWPYHSFFLDISLDEMKKRAKIDKKELDRMESQNDEFFMRTRQGYLNLARENQKYFTVLDSTLPIEVTQEKIRSVVNRIVEANNPGIL